MSSCMLTIPLWYINTMTTRLNNSMIMVHLIRSLLTNLNNMIAIEAKYVELCNYTVAYVGLITSFLQRSSAVEEGPRNACRSDFYSVCQSWRCVVWWFRCTLQYCGLVLVEFVRSEGRSLCAKISPLPTIFGVVSQRAELSSWAARRAHGRAPTTSMTSVVSYRIPRCRIREATFQRFDNRCCFE